MIGSIFWHSFKDGRKVKVLGHPKSSVANVGLLFWICAFSIWVDKHGIFSQNDSKYFSQNQWKKYV